MAFGRQVRGISQDELAARLGVTQATISKWECDQGIPDSKYIGRIAHALKVPVPKLWPRAPYI